MDNLSFLLLFAFLWVCINVLISTLRRRKSGQTTQLPPGPRPLPIVGNIFELGKNPHKALASLSKTYGPLMTLKLGSITTIVISSPDIAKEALQKHDQALSSRTIPHAIQVHNHHKNSMIWVPAVAHWKSLRKVAALQMFTSQRLDASQALRQRKVQELLDYVQENCNSGCAVDIGRAAFTTALNLISNTFFSINLASYRSHLSQEFNDLVCGIMEEVGRPNLADYFPILRLVDPQGVYQRMKMYFGRFFKIIDDIINERTKLHGSSMASKTTENDALDSLIILVKENNSDFSFLDLRHLLADFFVAGTDATSSTVQWAMAELLRNPEKLVKLKNELKELERPVLESDIFKLPYLQAIVKETFRLHSPAPLLLPRKADCELDICGFKVPKNAQILVNVWAIAHDESIWKNPEMFIPERFLESEIDVKGRDFELIPFGAGRRMCPGLPLAHRMVHLMLASLVQSFDWKLEDGLKPENMDMSDYFGISLHKAEPLRAIPVKVSV